MAALYKLEVSSKKTLFATLDGNTMPPNARLTSAGEFPSLEAIRNKVS